MTSTSLITAPPQVNPQQWTEDCYRWRGRLLTGVLSHWCWEWDFLPCDETCPGEMCCCTCFDEAPS